MSRRESRAAQEEEGKEEKEKEKKEVSTFPRRWRERERERVCCLTPSRGGSFGSVVYENERTSVWCASSGNPRGPVSTSESERCVETTGLDTHAAIVTGLNFCDKRKKKKEKKRKDRFRQVVVNLESNGIYVYMYVCMYIYISVHRLASLEGSLCVEWWVFAVLFLLISQFFPRLVVSLDS